MNEPVVFRLSQQRGPVVEQTIRRSERDWPLTLDDCQAALSRLLPQLKMGRAEYRDYCRWVSLTRTEMSRLYEAHRQSSRERQQWDLPALVGLRCKLELVTMRLYCAPWLPARIAAPMVNIAQFSRLTA